MSLKDFTREEGIPVASIQLDANNVRFDDPPGSQLECQRRLLAGNDGKKLLNLAEHIAANGVGLAPIVLSQDKAGTYTVRDGNRRIATLKYLNNPAGCPEQQYKKKFAKIRKEYESLGNIISAVDCWIGHNDDAILDHIDLQHAGQMDGAGQVPLETRAKDRLKSRRVGKKSRHGQVNSWLLDHRDIIQGIEKLDLTNVQRLVGKKKNLESLGFIQDVDGHVRPCKSENEIIAIWQCLLKRVNGVGDIYYAKQRDPIIEAAVDEAKTLMAIHEGSKTPSGQYRGHNGSDTLSDKQGSVSGSGGGERMGPSSATQFAMPGATSPKKRTTDRDKLIVGGRHTISIPLLYGKARDVLLELKRLNVKEHPIAASMMLRALLEHTLFAYCEAKGLLSSRHTEIKQLLGLVVKDCESSERIKLDRKMGILHRIGNPKKIESLATLNICMHDDQYYLTAAEVCSFYDQFDYLFTYWWNEVATLKSM